MIRDLAGSFKRHAWILAAAAAALLLLAVALCSPDRQKGLGEYQAAGPMRHIATADIVALRIATGERQWRFERGAAGWQMAEGGAMADAAASSAIESGLRLLHNTPPERSFDTDSPDFGLAPAALRVSLATTRGVTFEAEFGNANPMGLARYVRVRAGGQNALHLMPVYVAEPWERVTGKLRP
jgi:hypothetical protein